MQSMQAREAGKGAVREGADAEEVAGTSGGAQSDDDRSPKV